MLGDFISSTEASLCICSAGRKIPAESLWGLQLTGMDGRTRWDERGEARSKALSVHIFCKDQTMENPLNFHNRVVVK